MSLGATLEIFACHMFDKPSLFTARIRAFQANKYFSGKATYG